MYKGIVYLIGRPPHDVTLYLQIVNLTNSFWLSSTKAIALCFGNDISADCTVVSLSCMILSEPFISMYMITLKLLFTQKIFQLSPWVTLTLLSENDCSNWCLKVIFSFLSSREELKFVFKKLDYLILFSQECFLSEGI